MIPNILHFVFGMAQDFGGKPFSIVHYLSIKSAVDMNKPSAAFFHYEHEPTGEWWERARPLLNLHQLKAPREIFGNKLLHVAHKADVVRLQVLQETGGIYLDLDTISVRPLTDLLQHSFVIGQEACTAYTPKNWRQEIKFRLRKPFLHQKKSPGLCNAVLLSEPNGQFVNHWLESYKTFRSAGRDKYWNEHSVQVPVKLALQYPQQLTIVAADAFHYPLYDTSGLKAMFEMVSNFPGAYLHHLWETFSWEPYLSSLTKASILSNDNTYNLIARRFL